jgi:hypothetical protein
MTTCYNIYKSYNKDLLGSKHPYLLLLGASLRLRWKATSSDPPLVGALDPQCFCVHRVVSQVAECSGGLPSRARAKERGRETYRS